MSKEKTTVKTPDSPTLSLDDYQKEAMTTCLPTSYNFEYMLGEIEEEVGELRGKVNKAIRHNIAVIDGNNLILRNITDDEFTIFKEALCLELGDVLWGIAGLASVLGWKLEDVAQKNLNKLYSRKARQVIDGKGDNR